MMVDAVADVAVAWGEHWTSMAVVGPLVAAVVAMRGTPWAIRLGLALGVATTAVAATGLWLALATELPNAQLGDAVIRNQIGGWGAPLGIELRADGLAVVFLALTAVVGAAVSVYSTAYFGDVSLLDAKDAPGGRGALYFAPLWLLLWTALNGIYLSADIFNLYVLLEILGLSAAAIVTLAVSSRALVAGMRYLLVSLAGSMLYLVGVALLYVGFGTLSMDALAGLRLQGPLPAAALAIMTIGLAAKSAMFPLHGWLPPAHASAPAPGSAVLSALVVKGSLYVIIRLWVDVYGTALYPDLGLRPATIMGLMGAGAIIWGSALALRQRSLKRLIAYSTVAQLGYLGVMFPLLGSPDGGWSADAWAGGIYHALAHATAKSAMFLAAGSMTYAVARDDLRAISGIAHRLPMSFLAFGLGGLALAGIPPSGGFIAKWLLLRAAIAHAGWGWAWAVLISIGGLLALAYVLKVLRYAIDRTASPPTFRPVPKRMEWSAMALGLLAVMLGVRATEVIALILASLPHGIVQ